MATLSSIPACRIPMDGGAWRATVHGVTKSHLSQVVAGNHGFPLLMHVTSGSFSSASEKSGILWSWE